MFFELSEQLQSDIMHAMENQTEELIFDSQTGNLVSVYDINICDSSRYYTLPEWNSADGYRIMEKFAYSLRNPPIRTMLHDVLLSGKGVFRGFKTALKPYPEIERLWLQFKHHQMLLVIKEWYNTIRVSWGLEKLGEEPEDTENLIQDDFILRYADIEKDLDFFAAAMVEQKKEFAETLPESVNSAVMYFYSSRINSLCKNGLITLIAESVSHEAAGYISVCIENKHATACIVSLFVFPSFRGMGVGTALLSLCFDVLKKKDITCVIADCFPFSKIIGDFLSHKGFCMESNVYWLDI